MRFHHRSKKSIKAIIYDKLAEILPSLPIIKDRKSNYQKQCGKIETGRVSKLRDLLLGRLPAPTD
jgi:hypothetical protein